MKKVFLVLTVFAVNSLLGQDKKDTVLGSSTYTYVDNSEKIQDKKYTEPGLYVENPNGTRSTGSATYSQIQRLSQNDRREILQIIKEAFSPAKQTPKSVEQRILELEKTVRELKAIVENQNETLEILLRLKLLETSRQSNRYPNSPYSPRNYPQQGNYQGRW